MLSLIQLIVAAQSSSHRNVNFAEKLHMLNKEMLSVFLPEFAGLDEKLKEDYNKLINSIIVVRESTETARSSCTFAGDSELDVVFQQMLEVRSSESDSESESAENSGVVYSEKAQKLQFLLYKLMFGTIYMEIVGALKFITDRKKREGVEVSAVQVLKDLLSKEEAYSKFAVFSETPFGSLGISGSDIDTYFTVFTAEQYSLTTPDLALNVFPVLKDAFIVDINILFNLYQLDHVKNTNFLTEEDLTEDEKKPFKEFVTAIKKHYGEAYKQNVQGVLCAFEPEMLDVVSTSPGFTKYDAADTKNLVSSNFYSVVSKETSESVLAPVAKVYTMQPETQISADDNLQFSFRSYCDLQNQGDYVDEFFRRSSYEDGTDTSAHDSYSEMFWLSISSSLKMRPFHIQPNSIEHASNYGAFLKDNKVSSVLQESGGEDIIANNLKLMSDTPYFPYDLRLLYPGLAGNESFRSVINDTTISLLNSDKYVSLDIYMQFVRSLGGECKNGVNYLPDFHVLMANKYVYAYAINSAVDESEPNHFVPWGEYLNNPSKYKVFVCSRAEALSHNGGLYRVKKLDDAITFAKSTYLFYYKFVRDNFALFKKQTPRDLIKFSMQGIMYFIAQNMLHSILVLNLDSSMMVFRVPWVFTSMQLSIPGDSKKRIYSLSLEGVGHEDISEQIMLSAKNDAGSDVLSSDFIRNDAFGDSFDYLAYLYNLNQISTVYKKIYDASITTYGTKFGGSPKFEKYISMPEFAWRKYGQIFECEKPSLQKFILGRTCSGDLFSVNMALPGGPWGISLLSGSRSGKGVQTLSLLTILASLGLPQIYLDDKPEMSYFMTAISMYWNRFRFIEGMSPSPENVEILSEDDPRIMPTIPAFDFGTQYYHSKLGVSYGTIRKLELSLDGKVTEDNKVSSSAKQISDVTYFTLRALKALYFYAAWNIHLAGILDKDKKPFIVLDELTSAFKKMTGASSSIKEFCETFDKLANEEEKANKDGGNADKVARLRTLANYFRTLFTLYLNYDDKKDAETQKKYLNPSCNDASLGVLISTLNTESLGKTGGRVISISQTIPSYNGGSFGKTYPKILYPILSKSYLIVGKNVGTVEGSTDYYINPNVANNTEFSTYVGAGGSADEIAERVESEKTRVAKGEKASTIGYFAIKTDGAGQPVIASSKDHRMCVIKPYLSFCDNDILRSAFDSTVTKPDFTGGYLDNLKNAGFSKLEVFNEELARPSSKVANARYKTLDAAISPSGSETYQSRSGIPDESLPAELRAESRVGFQGLCEYMFALSDGIDNGVSVDAIDKAFIENDTKYLSYVRALVNAKLSSGLNAMNEFIHHAIPGNENGEIYQTVYDFINDFRHDHIYVFDGSTKTFRKLELDTTVDTENIGVQVEGYEQKGAGSVFADSQSGKNLSALHKFSGVSSEVAGTPLESKTASVPVPDPVSDPVLETSALTNAEILSMFGVDCSYEDLKAAADFTYNDVMSEITFETLNFDIFGDEANTEEGCRNIYNDLIIVNTFEQFLEMKRNDPDYLRNTLYFYTFNGTLKTLKSFS